MRQRPVIYKSKPPAFTVWRENLNNGREIIEKQE
jgi:hypothetical protein